MSNRDSASAPLRRVSRRRGMRLAALAALCGYAIGSLPTDSVAWASVKLAFTLALLGLLIWGARGGRG